MAAMRSAKEPGQKAKQQEVVATIAGKLGETEQGPLTQISMVVRKLGPEQALVFLQEALAIEEKGGLDAVKREPSPEPRGRVLLSGKNQRPQRGTRPLLSEKATAKRETSTPGERQTSLLTPPPCFF